jgi:sulfur carrier protein
MEHATLHRRSAISYGLPSMIRVRLNGTERSLEDGTTVARLLEELGRSPQWAAVERNRDVVPRSAFATTALADGDVLEVVHLVGGG